MVSLFESSQIHNYLIDPNIHHKNPKIKHKFYATEKDHYIVLNYHKEFVCFDDNETSQYRSVICSYPEKQVLCFSPTKSVPYHIFEQNDKTCISERVEGIMINLFYDPRIKSWELATKSAVGCKYGKKYNNSEFTFYDMFIQALAGNPEKTLNENPIISMLPTWCSYSFIMSVTVEPRLTLVAVYSIQSPIVLLLPSNVYKEWKVFDGLDTIISFPKKYDKIPETNAINRKIIYGYMLQNYETGIRTKWFHPEYIMTKKTKKIKPTLQYQYACLRRVNKVYEYLSFFPKQRRAFHLIQEQYENYVNKVHHYYMEHFVKKKVVWSDIPMKYRDSVYKIHHTIYLAGLAHKMRIMITINVVKEWLRKKEPMEVVNILNSS